MSQGSSRRPSLPGLPPRPRPLTSVYDAAYTGVPNWDIGRPQRAFVALEEAGLVESPVLDVGCGTGELSLYLARRGYQVLGIDLARTAIEQAREKARWRRIDADFLVWDALRLDELAARGFRFRTVLDCAMFHVLGDRERDVLVDGLTELVPPGGRFCVLGDRRFDPRAIYGITPEEVRERFVDRGGWELSFARETVFQRRYSQNPAWFICLERV